ncbi:hypothetical protein G6F46_011974 [Rhizopus delemar]|uniref:DUF7082 domain-containing protein n=2 Tax=Rhizopus TaxID=4842 RepID=A0A9P7CIM3_9FUNG|nr:hypothetical protein G6F55_011977 [Rhizopus delemar]KAG1534524.1 hypothetical protein G6F51_012045 [Rhizopus arrhizus]KAG1488907.1 hypothetical protein G6F54_011814 [Rhizopus delemar]KAG1509174.1 hypothetical protein G6F52_011203 [Rhizopus delemar]KAG1512895.1 hypothetical protein G6F53_004838 [Rhizopus delemar]
MNKQAYFNIPEKEYNDYLEASSIPSFFPLPQDVNANENDSFMGLAFGPNGFLPDDPSMQYQYDPNLLISWATCDLQAVPEKQINQNFMPPHPAIFQNYVNSTQNSFPSSMAPNTPPDDTDSIIDLTSNNFTKPLAPAPAPMQNQGVIAEGVSEEDNSRYAALGKAYLETDKACTESMKLQWQSWERQAGRRIVLFTLKTEYPVPGSNIRNLSFHCHPIRKTNCEDKKRTPFAISCIYWETKRDYFVTSTDVLWLFACLLSVTLTKEEKNRMRRNLQNLDPITVTKDFSKPHVDVEFFHRIMAYKSPVVRNIDKDIKVFRWSNLCDALNKISKNFVPSNSSIVL